MTYEELREQYLSSPEARKYYEECEPECEIRLAVYCGRKSKKMTQQDLADKTGMDRADISKIENGSANPTLKTLEKLAKALGKELIIKFE